MYHFHSEDPNQELTWESLGDIAVGREKLGEQMPVAVYRLLQYSIKKVLNLEYGAEKSDELFRAAGFASGVTFAKQFLSKDLDFDTFVSTLQNLLRDMKIGILRIEEVDLEKMEILLTVGEDLDCSGLPVTNESVCAYDEGFLAGILNFYTGKDFTVREIDCWATGGRVCRFEIKGV